MRVRGAGEGKRSISATLEPPLHDTTGGSKAGSWVGGVIGIRGLPGVAGGVGRTGSLVEGGAIVGGLETISVESVDSGEGVSRESTCCFESSEVRQPERLTRLVIHKRVEVAVRANKR